MLLVLKQEQSNHDKEITYSVQEGTFKKTNSGDGQSVFCQTPLHPRLIGGMGGLLFATFGYTYIFKGIFIHEILTYGNPLLL